MNKVKLQCDHYKGQERPSLELHFIIRFVIRITVCKKFVMVTLGAHNSQIKTHLRYIHSTGTQLLSRLIGQQQTIPEKEDQLCRCTH